MSSDLIQFLAGMLVGGVILALVVLKTFALMYAKTIDARYDLRKLQEQHNDVVNAAQKLLEEVTRYRRMQAIWTARVLQRANRNEFADVEYVEVPE